MPKINLKGSDVESIQEGYDVFKRYCLTRNYSQYTIKHYDNTIHVFELFYTLDNDIGSITQELIEDFMFYLMQKDLAGKTVATYIGSLRTIMYFFMRKEYINSFHITKPKFDKPLKEVYKDTELNRLLKKPDMKNVALQYIEIGCW